MALPPQGHPARPLHLAARTARVMGILFLILGGLAAVALALVGTGTMVVFVVALVTAVYIVPAIAFLVISIYVDQKKQWALITLIVIDSLHLLFGLLGLVSTWIGRTPSNALMMVISLIWIVGDGAILIYSVQGLKWLKSAVNAPRGFDPIPVARPFDPGQSQ